MMKRYDSYKDSGIEWIGEIPSHWIKKKLGYSIDTIVPMRDKPTSLKGEIPWIRIEDYDGKFIYGSKSNQGVTQGLIDEMNLKVYPINTVLTTCSCSFGTSMIVKEPMTSNQTFIGLFPNKKDLNEEYLYYQLHIWEVELDKMSSGSIQKYLSRDNFKSLRFLFPPLSEQQQIVSFLDTKTSLIDSLIEKTQRKIELLKEKRTSLINEVVTKGLNPNVEMKDSGVEWIGEIPSHWDTVKVKYLGNIRSGDGLESNLIEDEGDYPVYGGNGVLGYYSDFNYSTNVLSIGRVGEKCGNVHFINEKVWINDNSLVLEPNSKVESLWYIFHSLTQRDLNQLRNKNTQPLITGTLVKNEYIPFPRKSEQQQIVEYLDEQTQLIDNTISIEEKRVELLKEYRQSLISEVVTGKLKVTN